MRISWNEYFMVIAKLVSTRSTCNSRPTGAVIVRDRQILSTGYNGSMPGAPHCSDEINVGGKPYCYRRTIKAPEDDKYNFCRSSHAEANAIARAAKMGIPLDGSTLFVTLAPCYVCLKLLANAGIKHIFYEYRYESTNGQRDTHWQSVINESPIETFEELKISNEMLLKVSDGLKYPTSGRRLSENYEPISEHHKIMPISMQGKTYEQFKAVIVDCIMGVSNDSHYYANKLSLSLELVKLELNDANRVEKAKSFMKHVGMIEHNTLSMSDNIKKMIVTLISHQQYDSKSDLSDFNLKAEIRHRTVKFVFHLEQLDVWNQYIPFVDSCNLIANEVYSHLLDRYDIDLSLGVASILIDRPYISFTDKPLVKAFLGIYPPSNNYDT